MAEIPRKYIDEYTKALNTMSADVQKRLADDLAKIDFTADVATVREAIIARMEFYLGPYTDMAAVVAAEFYDGVREVSVGERIDALADSGREPIATEKAVRGIMQDIVEGKAAEVVIRKLVDRADYEIKKSAGECVYRNGKRDPLKPKYARVPSGGETCRFCIMLASRGFVYRTEEAAGEGNHYHANCDCRIVPGFDGETFVPGYDPDKLYDQWKHPEKYPELQEARNSRRSELYAERAWKLPNDTRTRDEIRQATKVNDSIVSSGRYEKSMASLVGDRGKVFTDSARKALAHRDETVFEDLYAINLDTGKRVSVRNSRTPKAVIPSQGMKTSIQKWANKGQRFAMLHNHPESSIPSMEDIRAIRDRGAEFGIVACHDGSLYKYSIVGEPIAPKTLEDNRLFDYIETCRNAKKPDETTFANVEKDYGVRIEFIAGSIQPLKDSRNRVPSRM